ncbi:MAG TPA: hypothetical protein VNB86_05785 [Gaiellaceae bacterium]|jgi:hypothetical protein|nr:hypothetical protein [Gaiellaceae bacterium]
MFRLVSTTGMLVGLAVAAFLWSQQATHVRTEAPTAILEAAQTGMELNHRIRGTYAGVSFGDVKVVRADANTYCIEAIGYFVAGPDGRAKPGHC